MKFIAVYAINTWTALGFLNQKAFNWLGFISFKPVTEDYVPLIPWLGVMWWGMAATQWLLRQRPALLTGSVPPAARLLVWMGGCSLVYYMLHQPVMIGLLWVVQQLR